MTKIIDNVEIAADEILKGNIIGLPTETVYGLGANALNENAVIKIFEAKQRPRFNPVIVHIYNAGDAGKYAALIPENFYRLSEKFSPGPLTFVLKKKDIIPDIVTSGNDSVALRIPAHSLFREVLKKSELPIAAPSANMFGKISPTSAEDVLKDFNGRIDFILDGGKCSIGIESTVVSLLDDEVKILRHGFITREEIEKVTGKITDSKEERIISPGQMKIHYAPSTPLYMVNDFNELVNFKGKKIGVLDFSNYRDKKEIALNLFSDLRKLDAGGFEFIVYKKVTDEGLGAAINDRLERAGSGELILNYKL